MNFFELLDSGIAFVVEVYSEQDQSERLAAYKEYCRQNKLSFKHFGGRGMLCDVGYEGGMYRGWNPHKDYVRYPEYYGHMKIFRWEDINPANNNVTDIVLDAGDLF